MKTPKIGKRKRIRAWRHWKPAVALAHYGIEQLAQTLAMQLESIKMLAGADSELT